MLDYNYFNNHYKMTAIDLTKQQVLVANPKAIQRINFTGNLEQQAAMFFIIEEAKEIILNFLQETVKVLRMSSYDLGRVAKVFDHTAFPIILFSSNIILSV